MSHDTRLEKLLDIVEQALQEWNWFPETDVGTTEALIPSKTMIDMQDAWNEYLESDDSA